jgi:hypothetical protein
VASTTTQQERKMSTRATYQIKSGFSTATLYIHHDGYFQGAASYFQDTLDLMRITDRPLLPCFLWANERAELTTGHQAHGDTEYHYDLEKEAGIWIVTAYKRRSYDSNEFEMEWMGPLSDFVNEFKSQEAA